MESDYPRGRRVAIFVLVVMVASPLVLIGVRYVRDRQVRERIQAREQSRLALLRYVQLRHGCSEEAAYQRIAAFVIKRVPLDDLSYIESTIVHDRQALLERAQSLLMDDPDQIDEI